ncbi:MAG: diacylglycerol/lipid kinase family protein [Anaerotardibacter sp.]
MFGNTLVIVNPVARSGKASEAAAYITSHLPVITQAEKNQHNLYFKYTVAPKDGTKIAYEFGSKVDTVITLGGDGLIHEVVNGLMLLPKENRPQLAVLPCGNGDDFGRTLQLNRTPEKALQQLVNSESIFTDIGKVNGEYFDETLSFGLDAAIALETMDRRKTTDNTGTILYFQAGLNQLKNHRDEHTCTITLDDKEPFTTSLYLIAVQNGPYYGGGFKICPDASTTDGLFNICYATPILSFTTALRLFASALNGGHVGHKNISFETARSVVLDFEKPIPAQIDGEPIQGTHFEISMEKEALRILYPKK